MTTVALLDGGVPADYQRRMRLAWTKACNWEGVHHACAFVVFSPENPYHEEYDQIYREWQEWLYPKESE